MSSSTAAPPRGHVLTNGACSDFIGIHHGAVPHGRDPRKVKAFVDFQSDVTIKDVKIAHQEGYRSVEHLKRYTTLGMGTDQGKTGNMNVMALAAAALGEALAAHPGVPLATTVPSLSPSRPIAGGNAGSAATARSISSASAEESSPNNQAVNWGSSTMFFIILLVP